MLKKWHYAIALFIRFNLVDDPATALKIYNTMLHSDVDIKINEKMAWNYVRQLTDEAEEIWRNTHQMGKGYVTRWENGKCLTFMHPNQK